MAEVEVGNLEDGRGVFGGDTEKTEGVGQKVCEGGEWRDEGE